MPPKILITRRIPAAGLELLETDFQVDINQENKPLSSTEIKIRGADAAAVITMFYDQVTEDLLNSCPKLKVVSNFAVGVDNIDIEACTRSGVLVTNTPGVLTDATADLTWALMLAVSRKIVAGDKFVRQGNFNGWDALLFVGGEMHRKILGIIGMGRIGQAVARRAKGFGVKVLYYQRHRIERKLEKELNATYAPLEDILKVSDYVSLHLPLTNKSRHLLNKDKLQLLKSDAYLINTARGPIVDEQALTEMLMEKRIAGAALDVYENEPNITPQLLELDNVVLAPHMGSANNTTRDTMSRIAAKSILAVFNNQKPANCINPEALKK